jgi:hypothetical protein
MNIALMSVDTEYLLFLNAGDEFFNDDALARASDELFKDKPKIAFYSTLICYESGRSRVRDAKSWKYYLYGQPAIHQSTIYNTELHKENLHDLNFEVSSDYAARQ